MPIDRTAHTEHSEEARALLQARLALFWKFLCWFMLFGTGLALAGAFKRPGPDLAIDVVLAAASGALWWLCQRGPRSARFLRTLELAGLLGYFTIASFLSRYVLIGFARERGLLTAEGALMADAYVSTLGLIGAALWSGVRAALIPSSPRRTALYTALIGVPIVLTPTLLAPAADGGLAVRGLDSSALPWLPAQLVMVWAFVVIASAVTSQVIYGLRAEVREARRMGQYVLEEKIGEGGMGEVYRARHGMMRRPSALKLLRADLAGERAVARFECEVQLTARLSHPSTITIYDYGRTDDGVFYYAMELLDGATLQRIVEVGGPQAEGRMVRILTMACGALAEAHATGVIHRDIKPANIMLCTQGGEPDVAKLLDFGLVKDLAVPGDARVSVANTLTGTPHYMAPEAIASPDAVDARTDLYGLGAVAYFLLAGGEVFRGRSVLEVCSQHLHQEPDPFAARGVTVSAALEAVVLACLEKDPDRRPQTAVALRERLAACPVEPWTDADARRWWRDHPAALASGDAAASPALQRTVAVDGATR